MIDTILNQFYWLRDNYVDVLISLAVILVGLEGLVRLTPTKSDDAFLARMSAYLTWIFEKLKIPNVKLENGKIVTHQKKADGESKQAS